MSTEKSLKCDKLTALAFVNEQIDNIFKRRTLGKFECNENKNGVFFRVYAFPVENALCVEYADDEKGASRGIFGEDGDRFYLDEYETLAGMLSDIIAEIEEAE